MFLHIVGVPYYLSYNISHLIIYHNIQEPTITPQQFHLQTGCTTFKIQHYDRPFAIIPLHTANRTSNSPTWPSQGENLLIFPLPALLHTIPSCLQRFSSPLTLLGLPERLPGSCYVAYMATNPPNTLSLHFKWSQDLNVAKCNFAS